MSSITNSKFKAGDKVRWKGFNAESDQGVIGEFVTIVRVIDVKTIDEAGILLLSLLCSGWTDGDKFVYSTTDGIDDEELVFTEGELEEVKNETKI